MIVSNSNLSVTGAGFNRSNERLHVPPSVRSPLPPIQSYKFVGISKNLHNNIRIGYIQKRDFDRKGAPKSVIHVKNFISDSNSIVSKTFSSKPDRSSNIEGQTTTLLDTQTIAKLMQSSNLQSSFPQRQQQNHKGGSSQLAHIYFQNVKQSFQQPNPTLASQIMLIAQTIPTQAKSQEKEKPSRHMRQSHPFVIKDIIPLPEEYQYKYYLGGGNNVELVRRILQAREGWEEVHDPKYSLINFKWQQGTKGYKYERLLQGQPVKQLVNHFEHHREISNKQYLLKNLIYFCENIKINVYDFVPITYILDFDDDQIDINLTSFLKFFNNNSPQKFRIYPEYQQKKFFEIKRQLKVLICQNERKFTINHCKPRITKNMTSEAEPYLWLLKPTFLNRGRGIHVFNELDALTHLISEYQNGYEDKSDKFKDQDKEASSPEPDRRKIPAFKITSSNIIKANAFVVQKYIERPLLIHQRKFDIRVWVLVSHEMDCYFFKEGYIRTSSESFRTDQLENFYIHLTNNAIQKNSENYGKFENGNQLSFSDLQKYLDQSGYGVNFRTSCVTRIKELVWLSLCSVRKKLNHEDRKFCMEIFGYDFILDQDFNVWLIEVNTNPCIEESSPLLEMLLPRALDDAFALTLDVLFPQKYEAYGFDQKPRISKYQVGGYSETENMWEMLGNLNDNQKINNFRKFSNQIPNVARLSVDRK